MIASESCCIVYIASKRQYVTEAIISAQSVRVHMPHLKIILKVSSSDLVDPLTESVFDQISLIAEPAFTHIDKAKFLDEIEFENVLFLDGDTYVCSNLIAAFQILERFDLAFCHAPTRVSKALPNTTIPNAFAQANTGVIFARNDEKMKSFFKRWRQNHSDLYERMDRMPDQPSFRDTLWYSDVNFFVLPPEYNARLIFPTFLSGEARILHCRLTEFKNCRFDDLNQLALFVNSNDAPRVFVPRDFENPTIA